MWGNKGGVLVPLTNVTLPFEMSWMETRPFFSLQLFSKGISIFLILGLHQNQTAQWELPFFRFWDLQQNQIAQSFFFASEITLLVHSF